MRTNLFEPVQPSHGLGPAAVGGGRGGYVQPGRGLGLAQRRLRLPGAAVLLGRRGRRPAVIQVQPERAAAVADGGRGGRAGEARVLRLGLHVPVLVLETAPVRRTLVLAPRHFRRGHRRRDRRERLQTVHDGPEHRSGGTSNPDACGCEQRSPSSKRYTMIIVTTK